MNDELTITPVSGSLKPVTVRLDEGSPTLTLNDTGWEAVGRPQKPSLVRWTGIAPITQDVPIIIDGFQVADPRKPLDGPVNKSVVKRVRALWDIAGFSWSAYDDGSPPAIVTIEGPGGIHFPKQRWVISGISEGETIRSNDGTLVRYHAVISLIRWRNADQIKVKRRPDPVKYTVKKGDTLNKIAVKVYKNRKYWKQIGNAQKPPIKDPDKELKVGRVLRLPKNLGEGKGPKGGKKPKNTDGSKR
ncbi:MAG TPA: LysM peptidoglycan-binding domain-containing protein [Solirubrobacterales bacterium]|nr:LysM peptidoglycan-binding domain-containing protein [Solirubrobacterales bacterium]